MNKSKRLVVMSKKNITYQFCIKFLKVRRTPGKYSTDFFVSETYDENQ